MTDIASLGIQVTTAGVTQASADLDKLTTTGEKAQVTATKTGTAWSAAAAKISGDTGSIVAELQRLNATQDSALTAFQGLSTKLDSLSGSFAATGTTSAAAAAGIATVGESAEAAATRIQAMVAASLEQAKADLAPGAAAAAKSLDDMAVSAGAAASATRASGALNSATVKQQIADYTLLDAVMAKKKLTTAEVGEAEAALDRLQAAGIISSSELTEAFTALDAATALNTKLTQSNSAAQVENAGAKKINSRTAYSLSALIDDAASGQFSRSKRELAALANESGLMAKLMSPLGLGIGAVVGVLALFAVGAAKGAAASEALRKSVIATGGAAGLTGSAFRDIAQDVGKATGSYSGAAEAATVFSNSTKVAGASVGTLAAASINMAKVTGESVSKAAQEILSLGDDPAAAVVKLNDKYNIFTASQYAQISALQASGQAEQAAALAQGIAAEAFQKRVDEVNAGAGILVRTAHTVGAAFGDMWNSINNIGATQSIGDQIKGLQDQIRQLGIGRILPNGTNATGAGKDDPRVKALQAQIDALNAQQGAHIFDSTNQSTAAFSNQASIAAQKQLSSFNPPDVTLENKLKQAAAQRLAALYGIVDPAQKSLIEAQFQQEVTAANDAYQAAINKGVKKPPKTDPFASLSGLVQHAQTFDAGVGDTKPDNEQVKAILAIVDAGARLIQSGKDVAKVQALVSTGVSAVNDGYAKQAVILKGENAAAIKQYQASLDKQNAALQQSIDAQVTRITLGAKEAAQQQQLSQIQTKNADELAALQTKRDATKAKGGDTTVLDGDIAKLQANMATQVAIVKNGWDATDAASADGMNGVHTAITNFMDETKNNAAQMQTITTSFLNGFSDAFAGFVSGTEDAKKAFGGLIDSMYTQALKLVANKALSAIFTSFGQGGGGFSSLLGNLGTAFGFGGSTGLSAIPTSDPLPMDFSLNANGGVYNSRSLSEYSGKIVDRPTMFAFANGGAVGVMGEAGQEAILPLRRNAQGKLGVEAPSDGTGSSARGPVSVNQTIVVQGKINRRTSQQMAQDSARVQRIAQTRNG